MILLYFCNQFFLKASKYILRDIYLVQIVLGHIILLINLNPTIIHSLMQFYSLQDVERYAQDNSKLLVVYDTYVLDVTSFVEHHPGGASLISNMSSKDITKDMAGHFPLSYQLADSMAIGSLKKQIQHYIDPNKPLMPQIWNISHDKYLKIIHLPHWVFQESPRMFQSDKLEKLSYCVWYNIFFVPYLLLFYYYKTRVEDVWTPVSFLQIIVLFFSGILLFSLTQYILHRFLFHSEKRLYDNPVLRYMHFITHGIHHMFPFDPYRLVLPPALTIIFLSLLYSTFYRIIHFQNYTYDLIFYIGYLTGYISYDLIHYMIHHVKMGKGVIGEIFKKIEKHHNQHHFGGEERGYGVSSPLWDWVFGTMYDNKRGQ